MNMITVKGPELLSKYIGQSEKAVRDIFDKLVHYSETSCLFLGSDSFYGVFLIFCSKFLKKKQIRKYVIFVESAIGTRLGLKSKNLFIL